MSKADGRYIGIKFTEPITSDSAGLSPSPVGGYAYSKLDLSGAIATTLNQYSTSYTGGNAIDGSISTYWRGTTAVNWLRIQLPEAKTLTKLRLYMGSYYISTFTLSGSNDGSTWTQIGGTLTGASTTAYQWYEYELTNTTAYLYYRIDTLTAYNVSRIYLYEVELCETVGIGNETAFTVLGQEYDFVPNGTLQAVEYTVESVAAHLTEENAILLTITANDRFESVVGDITVAYDSDSGNLAGAGGPVESFSVTFTPAELVAKPHQNDAENVEITSLSATGALTMVTYTSTKDEENIEISGIAATGTLTNINDL